MADLRSITIDGLIRTYGLGDQPAIRRRLYAAVVAACERPGADRDRARAIVGAAMQAADHARDPARWWCRAVVARLREARLWAATADRSGDAPPTIPLRRVAGGDA